MWLRLELQENSRLDRAFTWTRCRKCRSCELQLNNLRVKSPGAPPRCPVCPEISGLSVRPCYACDWLDGAMEYSNLTLVARVLQTRRDARDRSLRDL